MAAGDLTQEQEDAVVNGVVSRLINDKGLTMDDIMEPGTPGRKRVEDSLDRHAARQRKAGKAGW